MSVDGEQNLGLVDPTEEAGQVFPIMPTSHSETPPPVENEALNTLFSIDKKLESLAGIIPVERKEVLATAHGFEKTYTNLIPNKFKNSRWQGETGHTVRMDVDTFNWQIGLKEIKVSSPETDLKFKQGWLPFTLRVGNNNSPLEGFYSCLDGALAVGKGEDGARIEENERPFLYNYLALNVLGAYITTLIGQGDIRPEVARHQIQKTMEYRVKNGKQLLGFSLFNNKFPALYPLVSVRGLDEADKEAEAHPEVFENFEKRIGEIKNAIPQDSAPITELFENNLPQISLLKELDGGYAIAFLKDENSDNLIFRFAGESESTSFISGKITKGGDLVDFDLDLEKYPALAQFFRGFIITKYVQTLQEHGIVPENVNATEEHLIEPLNIQQKEKPPDVVPEGTFDDLEAMVREDQKEGEDVKRLETRLGYTELLLANPELTGFTEYSSTHKRRMWFDIPARLKTGKWMKEGQIYTSVTYSAGLREERNIDVTYLFGKDAETDSITYVRVDANQGTEPKMVLKTDGTIEGEGVDKTRYPNAVTHEESTVVEAFYRMLEDNSEIKMSEGTARSIASLERNSQGLIDKFYQLDKAGEIFREYKESLPAEIETEKSLEQEGTGEERGHELAVQRLMHLEQLYQNQPHADVLELNNTKRRRMWMDIPSRFKNARWMEEGKVYRCERLTEKGRALEGGIEQEMTFEKIPDLDEVICTFKRVMPGGTLMQKSILTQDGNLLVYNVGPQDYPHAVDAENDITVEAYYKTLEQEGLIKMSDTLYRSLASLDRRVVQTMRDFRSQHPDWDGAEYPFSLELPSSPTESGESAEPKTSGEQSDAIYFLSGGDGEGGLSKEFGEEYAALHRKYYQDLWKFVPTVQKNGQWIPEGRALKGSTVNGTDSNKFIEFKKNEDSDEILFSFHSQKKDGSPLVIDGTISANGKINLPDIDAREYLGTHDALNSQVVYGYLDLLMARHAVRRTKEMGRVIADYQKGFDDIMLRSAVETQAPLADIEPRVPQTQEGEKKAEDVITALIARTKGEMGEELFRQTIPELNKIRRRFWINTPDRYKSGKWIAEGTVYSSEEWEQGQLHPGAKIMDIRNITFTKDRSSERILAKTFVGDDEIELFINRDGTVNIPDVDLSSFGDDIEILQSGVIESYFRVLSENKIVTYNDSLNRSLAQMTNMLSKLNQGKRENPTGADLPAQPTEYRTLEEAVPLNEKGGENIDEMRKYDDFIKQKMGEGYSDFVRQSDDLSKKVWEKIPSYLRLPNWIQGEKRSYETKYTDNSASTAIDMRGVSFYHLQNFDLNNISNALTATIVFKNGHFDNKSLFVLERDGNVTYPSTDIKDTGLEAVFKRAIHQGYYKALVAAKRMQPIPELDAEIDEFEARFGSIPSQATDIKLSPEQIQINSERSMKRYDSIIDTLNPEERARIEELADSLRDGIWNSMPEKAKIGPNLTEYDDAITVSVPSPELRTFIAPYDTYTLAVNKNKFRGFFYGFTTSDLKDGVTFWQNTNGEILFDEKLPDTPGVKVAKFSALSLYADFMKARGEYDDSVLSEEHKKNSEEFTFLFHKAVDIFNVKEAQGETVTTEKTPLELLLERLKNTELEVSQETLQKYTTEIIDPLRHRIWSAIPPRFKNGRWMKEGQIYTFDYAENRGLAPDEESTTVAFSFWKNPETNQILFTRQDAEKGTDPPAVLGPDGRIEYEGIDKTEFPNAVILDEEFVDSAYSRMLTRERLNAPPESLDRSLMAIQMRNQPLMRQYRDEKKLAKTRSIETKEAGVDLPLSPNPPLLFREDTEEFIKLQDIKAFPEKREQYENFVNVHRQKAWSFVPPVYRTSSGIAKGTVLNFNLATDRENDPFKGTSLWIQHAPNPNDNRLYFSMNSPNPTIKGYLNPDGTIEVPGLDADKNRDGLNFLNLSIIQWYLGALEPRKVVDAVGFGKYWDEYRKIREESFFDCLVNLSSGEIEEPAQPISDTQNLQSFEAETPVDTLETDRIALSTLVSNYRKAFKREAKAQIIADTENLIQGKNDPQLLLSYLDFAFNNAISKDRREREDGVRLVHSFGNYLDNVDPESLKTLIEDGHSFMRIDKTLPFKISRLITRTTNDGTFTGDIPDKLMQFLDFVKKEDAMVGQEVFELFSRHFDELPEPLKDDYSTAIKTLTRQVWSGIAEEHRNYEWIADGAEYSFRIMDDAKKLFNPFDRIILAVDNKLPGMSGKIGAIFSNTTDDKAFTGLTIDRFGRTGFEFPAEDSLPRSLLSLAAAISYARLLETEKQIPVDEKLKQEIDELYLNLGKEIVGEELSDGDLKRKTENVQGTQNTTGNKEGVEKNTRRRLKPGEAGKELELAFDQLLQELAKSNTMEL